MNKYSVYDVGTKENSAPGSLPMVPTLDFVIQRSILYLTLKMFPSAQKVWLELVVAFVVGSIFTVVFVVESLINFILLFSQSVLVLFMLEWTSCFAWMFLKPMIGYSVFIT